MKPSEELRVIAGEDAIPVRTLRDFILQALRHDAISDVLIERMVSRAERGRLDAHSLSVFCPS